MDPVTIGAIMTGLFSLITTGVNAFTNSSIASENQSITQETNAQNVALAQEANAQNQYNLEHQYQIAVNDLDKAGLSKTLGVKGSGGNTATAANLTPALNSYTSNLDPMIASNVMQTLSNAKTANSQSNYYDKLAIGQILNNMLLAHDVYVYLQNDGMTSKSQDMANSSTGAKYLNKFFDVATRYFGVSDNFSKQIDKVAKSVSIPSKPIMNNNRQLENVRGYSNGTNELFYR